MAALLNLFMSGTMMMFDVTKAQKSGELNPIPYSVAKNRLPKSSPCWVTPVTWMGAPVALQRVDFLTIPSVDLVLPPPKLPYGYFIDYHDSWLETAKSLYTPDRVKDLTFEELDNIVRDWRTLEEFTGKNLDWFNIWDDRPDYCDWSCGFDDSWGNLEFFLEDSFEKLFKQAYPQAKPYTRPKDGIGLRTMAPTPEEALISMFGDRQVAALILEKLSQFPASEDEL